MAGADDTDADDRNEDGFLEGQFLIAMPSIGDSRFRRSVILICAHSSDGAMGLILNQPNDSVTFPDILRQLDLLEDPQIELPRAIEAMPIHTGGPVETGRGFVLHSADYFMRNSTLALSAGLCMTTTLDILKAIATGRGPEQTFMAFGYAGWGPGQLEDELLTNSWLHGAPHRDLVFEIDVSQRYDAALDRLGIGAGHLASEAGHA